MLLRSFLILKVLLVSSVCFAQTDSTITGVRLVCMKKGSDAAPQKVERNTDILKEKLKQDYTKPKFVTQTYTDTIKNVRIGPCTSKRWDATNHPLIVVDGVVKEFSSLESVNPNDIQSIEILKDQKATEKFGEKAKFGVILITMKCKEQKTPSL